MRRNKHLESLMLLLLFIYTVKVLVVMLYTETKLNPNIEVYSELGRIARKNDYLGTNILDVSQVHQCRNDDVFLVFLISSSPKAFDTRIAIRKTWANVPDAETLGVQTMFVIGVPTQGIDDNIQTTVFQENERYEDILLGNFMDTFRSSTLKYLTGLKWVTTRCSEAKFIFWGDDHLFVNYKRIVKQLRELKTDYDKYLWQGKIVYRSKAARDEKNKYYVSLDRFKDEVFPPFCTVDAGFILSTNAATQLYHTSLNQTLIPFPDAYTGITALRYNWTIINDDTFTYKNVKGNVCALRNVITSRGIDSTDNIYRTWNNLENTTFLRNCPSPDLDLVFKTANASNKNYFDTSLRLLYDHPGACYNDLGQPYNVFMVVLISSLPRHFESRDAIRKTWGGQREIMGESIKILFLMGLSQKDTLEIQQKVQKEDKQHGDIIQASFTESFQNLTLKVVMGLKWVTEHCTHAKYMYKGDDDMFVNFYNIIRHITKLRAKGEMRERNLLGSVLYRSVRVRRKQSKYYVPDNVYKGHFFPPYCSGGGYIICTDVIPAMYTQALTTPLIPIDDAFQGILADKVGAKPLYHAGFKNWGERSDTCSLRNPELMTIHGFKNMQMMLKVWRNYTDATVSCS